MKYNNDNTHDSKCVQSFNYYSYLCTVRFDKRFFFELIFMIENSDLTIEMKLIVLGVKNESCIPHSMTYLSFRTSNSDDFVWTVFMKLKS